jgi:hypothetical protein
MGSRQWTCIMGSHRVEVSSGSMMASTAGGERFMGISNLKITQWFDGGDVSDTCA